MVCFWNWSTWCTVNKIIPKYGKFKKSKSVKSIKPNKLCSNFKEASWKAKNEEKLCSNLTFNQFKKMALPKDEIRLVCWYNRHLWWFFKFLGSASGTKVYLITILDIFKLHNYSASQNKQIAAFGTDFIHCAMFLNFFYTQHSKKRDLHKVLKHECISIASWLIRAFVN